MSKINQPEQNACPSQKDKRLQVVLMLLVVIALNCRDSGLANDQSADTHSLEADTGKADVD